MMKKLRTIAIFCLFIIIFSCQQTKNNANEFKVEIMSEQLRIILKDYNREVLSGKGHTVITLTIDSSNDTTILFVSSLEEPDHTNMMEDLPGYFANIDTRPVLIYTGYEKLLSFNDSYIKEFEKLMNTYWVDFTYKEGEARLIPSNHNPVVWQVKIFNNKLIDKKDLSRVKLINENNRK